jgi:hypothetical protein
LEYRTSKSEGEDVVMKRQKVLAFGLDGLDITLAERLMAQGQMPALAALKKRAARVPLDEGEARRVGLPWEHVASGLSPEMAHRWSGVEFDPATYDAWQDGAHFAPWWAETDLRVLTFDAPFLHIARTRKTKGIVGWGSHSPGTAAHSKPTALGQEFVLRFGEYPANEWTYGTPWPSATRARVMGQALAKGLEVRSRAAQWLAVDRCPDWDLFYLVAAELHGGSEGLWHGVDASHPLHSHPSAEAAADALLELYRALDRMVGNLLTAVPDAAVLVFNMGGMCANNSDVQSMVLLPELLYRHAFGKSLLTLPPQWTAHPDRFPILGENETWDTARESWVPEPPAPTPQPVPPNALRKIGRRLPRPVKSLLKGAKSAAKSWRASDATALDRQDLVYMPGYRYRHYWPRMQAFAFPSFLDGSVRINLRGRERDGMVELSQYEDVCQSIETLLHECRDPRTGEPSVASIERASTNPMEVENSRGDLLIVWNGVSTALEHPRLGVVGPAPIRRTGGHNRNGFAYLAAPGVEPGDRDVRSSADIVPTIVELLGVHPRASIAGKSFLDAPVSAPVPVLVTK